MKYDGHVKLTLAAIKQVKKNCPALTRTCNAPLFDQSRLRIWIGDSRGSNSIDNYSAAVVNWVGHSVIPDAVIQVKLPDAVAFVDLDERWTHDDPKGQRYHFMRAPNESNAVAYANACTFIKAHTENWVNHAKRIMKKYKRPMSKANLTETGEYKKELALALHSLQDSYSPAHTDRNYGNAQTLTCEAGQSAQSAPIRSLFVYAEQDHDKHGGSDYESGGIDSAWGTIATAASAELISLGIRSIATPSPGLKGWDEFQKKWLSQRLVA